MARTSNKQKAEELEPPKAETRTDRVEQKPHEEEAEQAIEKLMKLYPNLEEMWITPEGFVHPKGVPEHYRKGAKLYVNKYYKQ